MVGPWISFIPKIITGRRKLSDIEFLSIKEFGGKLKKNEGFLSATGTLATLTASSGKDMYIARAQVVFYVNSASGLSKGDKVELQINGVNVETASFSYHEATSGIGVLSMVYDFKNIGHKVAATEIIKLQVTVLDSDVDVEGFIECFEETTGASPQIPSI